MKLPKAYNPAEYEPDIYALWEKSQAFVPVDRGGKGHFSLVVPPPNANGNLHLGHGLTLAIEDILVRYHRMNGKPTLFVPGADHAGFETWVVYEKELTKQGKSRFDFSREELYRQIWDFVAANKTNYEGQFRRLGASVDWSHYTYTLDDKIVRQAYTSFEKMFGEGLIYRAEKLVNFCTFHGTGFADIEVDHQEELGHLWHITYPLTDGSGEVVVATTRPETMLGDTAVAVHPDDKRYITFHGKTVTLPITGREVPIIADTMVDMKFGTGAVKITPAHDLNDYAVGERHSLPLIHVIGTDGLISREMPPAYAGLTVLEARDAVVSELKKAGSLVKTEEHMHSVGHCYKCNTVIQPLLREQWFVDMQPLAKAAVAALKDGKVTFHPANKCDQLITYLENLRDWNISRQIAWGIPIPAFQNVDNPEEWIFNAQVDKELITIGDKTYHRDPDVFDTWFSSSSWPYATLDFPQGEDYKQFYPLSVMETGADILYPWVSRMLMFGLYNTGEVPFKDVYLHGLILDEHGQKMSKSKGNVINPMDKIDTYGSDAFRLGIISGTTAGGNQPYNEPKLVAGRNFCNKLWNIARYVEDQLGDNFAKQAAGKPNTAADHWVLSKLRDCATTMSSLIEQYRLSEAYDTLYHFVWDDLADWYIEASKAQPNHEVLAEVLTATLKIAHPFAPFVTETIWQTLGANLKEELLVTAAWPTPESGDKKQTKVFEDIKTIVTEARFILSTLKAQGVTLYYANVPFLSENAQLIAKLAHLQAVTEVRDGTGLYLTSTPYRCWLDIDTNTAEQYQGQLADKLAAAERLVVQLEGRLNNKAYVTNAPGAVVEQTKAQLQEAQQTKTAIKAEAQRFKLAE
jgi:valyl-tRNA synthetase